MDLEVHVRPRPVAQGDEQGEQERNTRAEYIPKLQTVENTLMPKQVFFFNVTNRAAWAHATAVSAQSQRACTPNHQSLTLILT